MKLWIWRLLAKKDEIVDLEDKALRARNETDQALLLAAEKARLESVSEARLADKLVCSQGKFDVNGNCLTRLSSADGKFIGGGLVVEKCGSGWCKNRWMLNGDTRMGKLYANPSGAATPGDIKEWRTTTNNITKGDKIVPGFQLVQHGSEYYLPDEYRGILNKGRLLYKK